MYTIVNITMKLNLAYDGDTACFKRVVHSEKDKIRKASTRNFAKRKFHVGMPLS